MAKTDKILQIDPVAELKFRGPFTGAVTSYITLTNPSDHKICFKIKTTAPKKYCVRPNSGTLAPSETITIAVTLQPFDFDPNEKNKHKFMVQSIIAPSTENINSETLWKEASPDTLMDSKLKCVFEMPDDSESTEPQLLNDAEDVKKKDTTSSADFSESVIQKTSKEIARLREELSSTQRENLQLKEDLLKVGLLEQQVQSPFSHRTTQQAFAENSQVTPVIYLACGVLVGLMSMLLGKYIF